MVVGMPPPGLHAVVTFFPPPSVAFFRLASFIGALCIDGSESVAKFWRGGLVLLYWPWPLCVVRCMLGARQRRRRGRHPSTNSFCAPVIVGTPWLAGGPAYDGIHMTASISLRTGKPLPWGAAGRAASFRFNPSGCSRVLLRHCAFARAPSAPGVLIVPFASACLYLGTMTLGWAAVSCHGWCGCACCRDGGWVRLGPLRFFRWQAPSYDVGSLVR